MLANTFLIVAFVALSVVAAPIAVPSRDALVTGTQVMNTAKDL